MRKLATVFGLCIAVSLWAGIAMGAGTTSVVVQPSTDTVTVGNTTTVDIVVTSTTGGVGSLDLDIASTNDSVATVSNTSVAGNPETVQSSEEANGVRIAATGMDTADSGSTSVVSVTLTGKAAGTSDVDLTVAAVGDESGTAYNVTSVRDGTLTVKSGENATETPTPTPTATETPTETPTEEDSSSSGGSNSDDGDDDDGSDSSGSDSGDTVTATDTPTVTEPTPSDTPTTTTTEVTERSTKTDTEESTSTQTSSGGPAITPSQTAATDTVEPSGGSPTNLLIGGSMIVAVLGGIIIYRRL